MCVRARVCVCVCGYIIIRRARARCLHDKLKNNRDFQKQLEQLEDKTCEGLSTFCQENKMRWYGNMHCRDWMEVLQPLRIKPANAEASSLRVLCLVGTHTKEHCGFGARPELSYTKRCTHLAYMSDLADPHILPGSMNLPHGGQESYDNLWEKTKATILYADLHKDLFDWVVMADSDAYIVVEHLRRFLVGKNSTTGDGPGFYIGGLMYSSVEGYKVTGYNQGGVYVLDRRAIGRAAEKIRLPKGNGSCSSGSRVLVGDNAEDKALGHCLYSIGIKPHAWLDKHGQMLFHPVVPRLFAPAHDSNWITGIEAEKKIRGASNESISWHKIRVLQHFIMEAFLYKCKGANSSSGGRAPPRPN